jgi:ABC-2 type transport system permease protein
MFKLRAALIKEFQLVIRDKAGLALMFLMPVVLVVLMTAIQNSAFELVNHHRIKLMVLNNDTSAAAISFEKELEQTGMFSIIGLKHVTKETTATQQLYANDAQAALIIPAGYFQSLQAMAMQRSVSAMQHFGIITEQAAHIEKQPDPVSLTLLFQPVLQESYRYSVSKSIQGVLQLEQNRFMIENLYTALNKNSISEDVKSQLMSEAPTLVEKTVLANGAGKTPNASQHNVPAWTLFAMFFTVISISSNLVREKRSGSFMRLRIMPTNYMWLLAAKQLMYLMVVLIQLLVIFSIGIFVFPLLGLPGLSVALNWPLVILISILCGLTAISYAMCVGVLAATQEQANGFGAVSVVILAALGGIFVPAFAMPQIFQHIAKLSPFYWGLELFYGVFLENRQWYELLINSFPLIISILVFQFLAFAGLKRQQLI